MFSPARHRTSLRRAALAAFVATIAAARSAHAEPIGPGFDPAPARASSVQDASAQPLPRTPTQESMPIAPSHGDRDAATTLAPPLGTPGRSPVASSRGFAGTATALAGVLLLILSLAWVFRKVSRRAGGLSSAVGAGGRAPAGLVEILARYPVGQRQTLVVLRFDRRVLLCSMSPGSRGSSPGMSVLSELTEPEDVASVLLKTRDDDEVSIARSFERTLRDADAYADRVTLTESWPEREPQGGLLARGLGAMRRGQRA